MWPAKNPRRRRAWAALCLVALAGYFGAIEWLSGSTARQALAGSLGFLVFGALVTLVSRRRPAPPDLVGWLTAAQRAEVIDALKRGSSPQDPRLAEAVLEYAQTSGRPATRPSSAPVSSGSGNTAIALVFVFLGVLGVLCAGLVAVEVVSALHAYRADDGRGVVYGLVMSASFVLLFVGMPLFSIGHGLKKQRAVDAARAVLAASGLATSS